MAVSRQDIALRDQDRDTLIAVFQRYPDIREVVLFGSRATGHAKRASDIDLAVTAPGMSDGLWARFKGDLDESPIILFIDVIRLDRLTDAELRREIETDGVRIHQQ